MSARQRAMLLRANAVFLLVAGGVGFLTDLAGIYFGLGPQGRILDAAPHAGIGFVEAHGLAVILGALLWRAASTRAWHLTAAAVHLLLGTSNVVLWGIFVATDMLAMGLATTALHGFFAWMQACAAAELPQAARA